MGKKTISAFEAKTHFSELLRDAEDGQSYVILRHGKPVAQLTPIPREATETDLKAISAEFRELREKIRKRTGTLKVKELIEEGRKY